MIKRSCLICGKTFFRYMAEIRKGHAKYCGMICRNKSISILQQKNGGYNLKKGFMIHRGYVLKWAPKHSAQVGGYVPEHRLVMEKYLRRKLRKDEIVHHKNRKKSDNRISNLEVMTLREHFHHHQYDDAKNNHKRKGNIQPVLVRFLGKRIIYSDAISQLGLNRSSVFDMRKRRNLSHQQVIDFYKQKYLGS